VSEDLPTAAGWYPLPKTTEGSPQQVGYWDGAAWTVAQRRANRGGKQPQDILGGVAVILLFAGLVGIVVFEVSPATLLAALFAFALLPLAVAASIAGLVRGQTLKFKTPTSLTSLIFSAIVTFLIVLPMALVVTGVWVLPRIG
jgi:Protein of unknown function (DUF2510)